MGGTATMTAEAMAFAMRRDFFSQTARCLDTRSGAARHRLAAVLKLANCRLLKTATHASCCPCARALACLLARVCAETCEYCR